MLLSRRPRSRSPLALGAGALAAAAALALTPAASAQEPAACLSADPAQWPAASKPYFMIIVDTSGSMVSSVNTSNSCGYENNRMGHARCAVKNAVSAFSGEVNFGLATYAWKLTGCGANVGTCNNCDANAGFCFPDSGCTATYTPDDDSFCGPLLPEPTLGNALAHAGGLVAVPLLQDHYWFNPPDASNVPTLLGLVDNNCNNSNEIGADSNTPLGGSLFAMNMYFSGQYRDPFAANFPNNAPLASPIGPATFNNQPAERPCRSVNIILLTDGDETCDGYDTVNYPNFEGFAVYEAGRLFNNGVTVSGQNFKIKTHVIGFAGATISALNNIAAAGGTGSAYSTANEAQLSQALANIIGGAIKPETCDNVDNNCNGCTDEGFKHYCNVPPLPNPPGACCSWKTLAQRTSCGANACKCCNWSSAAERTACLGFYTSSITPGNPGGDTTLLPCTTAAQQTQPANWLCYNPGDACDDTDNNCDGNIDENQLKCGSPAHCPTTEICNGQDDNCNGTVDEGCPACSPKPEQCDGCDNDCNGLTDDGAAQVSIPCGLPPGPGVPANCVGTVTCKPPQNVSPGQCAPGGGFTACNTSPQAEVCDGLDNNCNGVVDDGIASAPCVPANAPPGLNYGPNSACKMGTTVCVNGTTQCVGWVGPSAEVCDGIDNNCDGTVDNGNLPGTGQPCGVSTPPCIPGTTACVGGVLVCTGGTQPKPEICDGIDNNCNGTIDEAPLADAPAPGMNGCWTDAGNCCSFPNPPVPGGPPALTWCAPQGANCQDLGSLKQPCNLGVLACNGAQGWTCKNAKGPSSEVCNGLDDNCNGVVDDGVLPGVGDTCGSTTPPCTLGQKACVNGILVCQGGTQPSPEVCDGIDNDCNGTIDDGIPIGGPCSPDYDMNAYPGVRDFPPCQKGVFQCDGMGGLVCVGGVAPSPEVCDGIDNDCDGSVDEVGNPPDGINGTDNPFPPPNAKIGDQCGVNQGECKAGAYVCLNGSFACAGGQGQQPETCDCKDNDCDGQVDNPNGPNGPPLCGQGKDCVNSSFGCQCAEPCDPSSEFPCPGGQICQQVTSSQTGQPLGNYCISDPCGDCAGKTVADPASQKTICAPAGSPPDANCVTPPVCVCKGQSGCKDPCFGVTCNQGSICAKSGPLAGQCVQDNCFVNPCQSCNEVCNKGACAPNPCATKQCQPNEECKPNGNFTDATCIKPCGDVTCDAGKVCVDGNCVDDCPAPCANGEVCDRTQSPPTCVTDKCNPNPCTDGSYCDPVTGQCGNDPCAGIKCPQGMVCAAGQCIQQMSSSSSSSSSGGMTTSSSGGMTSGTGTGGAGGADNSVWGLATGGGGCACETSPGFADRHGWALAGLAAAIGVLRSRRRRRDPVDDGGSPGKPGSAPEPRGAEEVER